ncbi:MAG: 2-succinyl-5-enolpyruvyl-6-hydroxy-3-cyclohexene-1-carboxylic-acid synthase [Polyangiaceae bacterium]|nr:2-succinyl-5-enolpyruvyl-6-hydroxy-3-cyclohexene-1-carboxylic-acid synthase [Polyangiaceae bacterium]
MTEPSPQAEWARLLFGSFAQAGVQDVVISPGSRSTPFVWAAIHTENLRCHTILDERSAAFFALGQAKLSGKPTLLLCTSGTALAHYFPAIIESRLTSTPLVVLSADRPFELQAAKAPQTIDQVKIFGDFAEYFELGTPEARSEALHFVRRLAFQAVLSAQAPGGRPSHVNARARKPLEPQSFPELHSQVSALLALGPPPHAKAAQSCSIPPVLSEQLRDATQGLLFSGPEAPAHSGYIGKLLELARRTGWPIVVDAASPLRFLGPESVPPGVTLLGFAEWFLPNLAQHFEPEVAIHFGEPMVPTSLQACAKSWVNTQFYAASVSFWNDPENRAAQLPSQPEALLNALLEQAPELALPAAAKYAAKLQSLESRAAAAVEQAIATQTHFSESQAVRLVAHALPKGSLLVLGNSLPIRDFGAFVARSAAEVQVLSQRGANGIDGLLSGAAGAASVFGKPTTLVLGDLSFVHDLGGLWSCQAIRTPVVIVVIDNGGGRIFEQLPIQRSAGMSQEKLQHWVLDHSLKLDHAAAVFGLPAHRISTAQELEQALKLSYAHAGASLLVVSVAPHGAEEANQRVRALLAGDG